MGEDVVESHTDSYVEQILTAVNMEGRLYTGNQLSNWSINGLSLPFKETLRTFLIHERSLDDS